MDPLSVFHQQVQFTQGTVTVAQGQVGRPQPQPRRALQGELPESFVLAPQAAIAALGEPGRQGRGGRVLLPQPVGQTFGVGRPVAGGQRMTGVGGCQQGRRDQVQARSRTWGWLRRRGRACSSAKGVMVPA